MFALVDLHGYRVFDYETIPLRPIYPTMNRRSFLKSALVAGGLCSLQPAGRLWATAPIRKPLRFGFISGIVKAELLEDWRGTLAHAASLGYQELETGSPPEGVSVREFVTYCKQVGLDIVAGGVKMTGDPAALRQQLDALAQLHPRYAVCYWPWNTGAPFSLEHCQWSAPVLNQMGTICREYGLGFCWHNHDKEFHAMEQGLPFDYLMQHTDPDLVACQLDVYWAAKGGVDPVQCLRNYPGRYPILHLKDMTADSEATFACVGDGIVDFPAILKEARAQGTRHYILEKDKATDGPECLESAIAYLRSLPQSV